MKRIFDAAPVNEVVNTPGIYEWVHGAVVGPIDVTPMVENRLNVVMWGEFGGIVFLWQQPGLYEMHAQCLKEGRGKWMLQATHEAFQYLFTHTDAVEIVTRVPKGNFAAAAYAITIGFEFEFERPNGWVKDHKPVPVKVHSKTIQNWIRTAPGLEKIGHDFHDSLEAQYLELGKLDGVHDEDLNHDRYVGATVAMVHGGQPYKAMVFYNRWARLAGYQEISILKPEPVIMDIRDAILMFSNNEMKVVTCQLH